MYDRKIRISVSNLDLDFLDGPLKEPLMEGVKSLVDTFVAPKFDMDLDMVWGADGQQMRLQAIEHAQSPINRHPVSGRPVWFCNMHNHARFLRERRPCSVPEVGMTDVFYGDLEVIEGELLEKVNEACEKNIVSDLTRSVEFVHTGLVLARPPAQEVACSGHRRPRCSSGTAVQWSPNVLLIAADETVCGWLGLRPRRKTPEAISTACGSWLWRGLTPTAWR